jgi:hypothetical protein
VGGEAKSAVPESVKKTRDACLIDLTEMDNLNMTDDKVSILWKLQFGRKVFGQIS